MQIRVEIVKCPVCNSNPHPKTVRFRVDQSGIVEDLWKFIPFYVFNGVVFTFKQNRYIGGEACLNFMQEGYFFGGGRFKVERDSSLCQFEGQKFCYSIFLILCVLFLFPLPLYSPSVWYTTCHDNFNNKNRVCFGRSSTIYPIQPSTSNKK